VILVLMATVLSAERLRTVRTALLVAALALNVANQRGSFYERKRIPWPPSEFVDASLLANDGNVLERSMEYRDDLLLTRDVVAELDGLDRERTVLVTHWPLTQALAIPELGYVERPWRTSGRGSRLTYDPNAVPYGDVYSDDDPPTRKGAEDDVVWVMAPNAYVKPYLAPRPDRDEMLAEIRRGNRSTFVFRRGGWE
jgi:hypothetical protein